MISPLLECDGSGATVFDRKTEVLCDSQHLHSGSRARFELPENDAAEIQSRQFYPHPRVRSLMFALLFFSRNTRHMLSN